MEEKTKLAIDTNTIFDFSQFLDTYANGDIEKICIQDMVDDKNDLIKDFVDLMDKFFHDSTVKSLFYKDGQSIYNNRNYPNYYDVNEMFLDMLQSDTLKESQKDVVFQLMKDNYKQFTQHYKNLLITYDKKTYKKIDNSFVEKKVFGLIKNNKSLFESTIKQINSLSTNTEVARMFKLGVGKNSKYEFIITSYVEKEIFTHIYNSKEYKTAVAELKRKELDKAKANKNNADGKNKVETDTISVFNEKTIRKILRQCSLVLFSEKARQRIEDLGKKFVEGKTDNVSGKKLKGVDGTQNKVGDAGDPNCVAAAQCLGLAFVSSNIKDLRNLGINITPKEYSKLAKKYIEEKNKIVPLANDHTFVMLNPPPKLKATIISVFDELQGHIDNSVQKNIQQTIAEQTCTSVDDNRMYSEILNPMEMVEHSDNNDIIEKDTLLGLQKPQLIESNIHKVQDDDKVDEREYNKIYNVDASNFDMTDEEKQKLADKNNLSNTISIQQGNQYNAETSNSNTNDLIKDNSHNVPDNDGGMQYNR